MSKVITFSRVFPKYHPKAGQETYFVRSIWEGLDKLNMLHELSTPQLENEIKQYYEKMNYTPKYHTIRTGNRWKPGDMFSPRVWSGKPYASKQIIIAPDIEIKKTFDLKVQHISRPFVTFKNAKGYNESYPEGTLEEMAFNDGFSDVKDLESWLLSGRGWDPVFEGQVICWNENINY